MVLAAVSAKAQTLNGDTWAQVQKAGSGSVTITYVETPSFVYKDAQGRLTGVCVDIMDDFLAWVESTKGVKVQARYLGNGSSFSQMFYSVKQGRNGVFGLGNVTITEARKKEISFSPPFIRNFAILITHNSVPLLRDMASIKTSFAGMKAYTASGTLNEKRILKLQKEYGWSNLAIDKVNNSPQTLQAVLKDTKSFTYLDLAFYLNAVKERKPVRRHPVGDESSEEFGIIMPLGSDWAGLMNEFFQANGGYRNSMSYKKTLVKHLGASAVRLIEGSGS